jgi:plastocyanin
MRAIPLPLLLPVLLAASACSKTPVESNNNNPPAHDIEIVLGAAGKGSNAFSPANLAISFASQKKVVWFNNDFSSGSYGGGTSVTHHLVSNDGTTFDSNSFQANATFTATFITTGVFPYHCAIHPSMVGTVTVNP